MSKLREQMVAQLARANYSESTIRSYVYTVQCLALHDGQCPSALSDEQVGAFLAKLREQGLSWSTVNAYFSGIKWFYTQVLDRPWNHRLLPRPRREKRLPEILSPKEVRGLIEATDNHSQLQTTAQYLHVRQSRLGSLDNPLDRLFGGVQG